MSGKLYVIGTPIGNIKDITLRAIEVLSEIDVLICEDSRVTGKLLSKYEEMGVLHNKPRLFAINEFNEFKSYLKAIEFVENGLKVGLVSDAGMPVISDPGYRVIREALDRKFEIQIIPGVTALTTAIPWSGVGGEIMVYAGFLPKTSGKALKILEEVKKMGVNIGSGKLVLYVSPHRVTKDLNIIKQVLGNVRVVLIREMTKMFEERVEGSVEEMLERVGKGVKGEIVLVVELAK